MKGALGKYFDAIFVISLDRRGDRRKALAEEMAVLGLADPDEISWVRAVNGEKCWSPGFFAAGAGAWGCLQSHLNVLQSAIMDSRGCILVMEDDATFHPKSVEMLELFFKQLPGDWDQIFLGGEHFDPPSLIKHRPFVIEGNRVHRTHAFAMKREVLPQIYQHIANYPDYMRGGQWHVDHQLGEGHSQKLWKTYAPLWWIVGQKGGDSDISEKKNPDYWWHADLHAPLLPMVFTPANWTPANNPFSGLVHFGNNLVPGTLTDEGLDKCVADEQELSDWLTLIASEALSMGMLPGIQHESISLETVSSVWAGRTLNGGRLTAEDLTGFPLIALMQHSKEILKLCAKKPLSLA